MALVVVGMMLSASGCGEPQPLGRSEESGAPVRLEVSERLGPARFGLPAPVHGPVAAIAGDARPVLQAPGVLRIASARGLAADEEGRVQAELALSPELLALPDAAFGLALQELPGEVADDLIDRIEAETFLRRVTSGWLLERGDGVIRLTVDTGNPSPKPRYSLHLSVHARERLDVESEPFEPPPGSILELAWGVEASASDEPVHFAARLHCGDDAPVALVDESVDRAGGAVAWRERAVPLPEGLACRLGLEAAGPDGGAARGALWARPRIVSPGPSADAAPNLVLVSLDTLRADHLSSWGYPRQTSPRIDAELVARGTAFLDVTTTYSRTDVSHMSLFTGLYPAARPEAGRLHADTPVPMLAERLAVAGFQTAAWAEDALLAGAFGFWFGFDRFVERPLVGPDRGVVTFADARDWLRGHADRRFFLFVHTYKTHAPFASSEAYASLFTDPADWEQDGMSPVPEDWRAEVDEYDRTIREADDLVGGLLDELDALGLAASTLVVVTSDHGEAFGEHRLFGHSVSSHQEVTHVPLVLRGPGVPAGLRVDTPVSLVDLAPTLLDLLGEAPLARTQGISLRPALEGAALPAERPLFFSWQQKRGDGVRYGPWKYHRRAWGGVLYNLEEDPGEREPVGGRLKPEPHADRLIDEHAEGSAEIRNALRSAGGGPVTPTLSEDVEQSLRALGYIE